MVQRGQNFGLTLKPRQPLWVRRERFGEDLQRDLAIELGIGGLIDLAHPALADEGGHVVVSNAGADLQGHRLLELVAVILYRVRSAAPAARTRTVEESVENHDKIGLQIGLGTWQSPG